MLNATMPSLPLANNKAMAQDDDPCLSNHTDSHHEVQRTPQEYSAPKPERSITSIENKNSEKRNTNTQDIRRYIASMPIRKTKPNDHRWGAYLFTAFALTILTSSQNATAKEIDHFPRATQSTTPSFKIYDSGIVMNTNHKPYWLDDNKLIFKGLKKGETFLNIEDRTIKYIYTWNYEHKPSVYRKTKNITYDLCYGDNNILYDTNKETHIDPKYGVKRHYVITRFAGPFGHEEEQIIDTSKKTPSDKHNTRFSHIRCDWSATPERNNDHSHWTPLRRGDGFVRQLRVRYSSKYNRETQTFTKTLYNTFLSSEDLKTETQLPIDDNISYGGAIQYYPHLGAYGATAPSMTLQRQRTNPEQHCLYFYIINKDTPLRKKCIAKDYFTDIPNPTISAISGGYIAKTQSYRDGRFGLYLLRDNKITRLTKGFSGRLSISPDGCKVAVVQKNPSRTDLTSSGRAIVIDVCLNKGNEQ